MRNQTNSSSQQQGEEDFCLLVFVRCTESEVEIVVQAVFHFPRHEPVRKRTDIVQPSLNDTTEHT